MLRLLLASFALYLLAADSAGRLVRLQLAALPDFDYAAEVAHLRQAERYGEAIMVADQGLEALHGPAREKLVAERDAAEAERSSVLRRIKEFGLGAVSGEGTSLERLAGAVTADLLVVGDVRDLAIQGTKWVVDGEADEVILGLSAVGIVTTVAPEADWAPSILKAARKTGAMTAKLGEQIKALAKGRKAAELRALFEDVGVLAKKASPGGALRALRYADDAADVKRLARFVGSNKAGAFAVHIAGREGAEVLKVAEGAAEAGAATARAEAVVVKAAEKGAPGVAWLRSGSWRVLLRAHPIVGIIKGVYKGNVQALAERIIEATDGRAWWLIPLLAAWVFAEGALVARRVGGAWRQPGPDVEPEGGSVRPFRAAA